MRNFLDAGQMSDRFYSLLLFLHIGMPLALLAGMWLHIQRVVRADVTPSRALALGTLATLAVLVVRRTRAQPGAGRRRGGAVPAAARLVAAVRSPG